MIEIASFLKRNKKIRAIRFEFYFNWERDYVKKQTKAFLNNFLAKKRHPKFLFSLNIFR